MYSLLDSGSPEGRDSVEFISCVFSIANIEPGHRIRVWHVLIVSQDTGVLVLILPLCDLGQIFEIPVFLPVNCGGWTP